MAEEDLTPVEKRLAERVGAELRGPQVLRRDFDADVMAEVRRGPGPGEGTLGWWLRPRTVRVSPLAGMLAAAAIVLVALLPLLREPSGELPVADAAGGSSQPVQFVFYAPQAGSVALVGDFNDWDRGATPLQRAAGGGFWSVTLPLPVGRHQYAFIVDGQRWMLDPDAPRTLVDDFGEPNSVVTVAGRS